MKLAVCRVCGLRYVVGEYYAHVRRAHGKRRS